MNKITVLLLALSLIMPTIAIAKNGSRPNVNKRQPVATVLSNEQVDTLLWMREEEKLARDIYLALDEAWDQAIFRNIVDSEQNHMDALLKKINTFDLIDPALAERGMFSNDELSDLYEKLLTQGESSYANALVVGVTIEDMDIADLIQAIQETENEALRTTYQNLLEGSKNHLRAFMFLMQQQGIEYEAQFIEQSLFDAILAF